MKIRTITIGYIAYGCTLLLSACTGDGHKFSPGTLAQLPEEVDYNYHIKPIISDKCFACHGPDTSKVEAGLRLDVEEIAFSALESGTHAFVPGEPKNSEVYHRILSHDPDYQMPPPSSNLTLNETEKALVVKWIAQGASYKEHWSFIPPQYPRLPSVHNKDWPNNAIDHFVLQKLEKESLAPTSEASKERLIRRLSFDLIGMPPSIEEIDQFTADTSIEAYEKVVDRLLASPHYGERMAVDWLDIARYADSHGYQDDGFRYVWPWRDWVIRAFNQNMPYDRFIQLQLAGDLLPNASSQEKLATTFLRNHRMNSEAGIVGEEYRVEYVADRTNTMGSAFLGLTLECARCHDHKYDPISQSDYYSLFAYFNNVNELGEIANEGNPGPLMMLMDEEVEQQVKWLEQQIAKEEGLLVEREIPPTGLEPPSEKELEQLLQQDLLVHYDFSRMSGESIENLAPTGKHGSVRGKPLLKDGPWGNAITLREYEHVFTGPQTKFERTDAFTVSLWLHPVQRNAYVPIWGDPSGKNSDFRGFGMVLDSQRVMVRLISALPHNHIQVRSFQQLPLDTWSHVTISYDGSSKARGVKIYVNGGLEAGEIMHDNLYKGFQRTSIRIGGGTPWGSYDGASIDEFRVYKRVLGQLEIDHIAGVASTGTSSLREYHQIHYDTVYQTRLARIDSFRKSLHTLTDTVQEIMVMEEMPKKRPAHVLHRGVYDSPQQQVNAAFPAVFGVALKGHTEDRLALAKWLTHPNHPLTARVTVNRLWKQLFGKGLVSTLADFGSQGSLPSHPALLDYLAVTLIESGWDIKALLKLMVMSATYRQSSFTSEKRKTFDPDNVWLSRGPRFRLAAEMLRDQALANSGLLVDKLGGPPARPYQPKGLWKQLAAIRNSLSTYRQDQGENLYRRSIYTIWKRTLPPPSMAAFDAPTRELCQVERQQTSTPLQALVLWNDPQWLEASRLLGERMLREGGDGLSGKIVLAFRLMTSRFPNEQELGILAGYYQQQRQKYTKDPEAAIQVIRQGEYPLDETLDPAELAASTMVAHTIMSLDEAIVRY